MNNNIQLNSLPVEREALIAAPPQRQNNSRWLFRVVADWSQLPGFLCVGGGLSTVGAGYATQNPYLLAIGISVSALGFFFPCLRFYCLRNVISLGRNVNRYEMQNRQLGIGLNELNEGVDKQAEVVEELKSQLQQANATVEKLRESYKEKEELNLSLEQKCEKFEKMYNELLKIYETIKKTVKESASNVEQFNKIGAAFDKNVRGITNEDHKLEKGEKKLEQITIQIEKDVDMISKESKEMQKLLKQLDNGVNQIQERFAFAKEALEELKLQLSKLENSEQKIAKESVNLETLNKNFEHLCEDMQQVLNIEGQYAGSSGKKNVQSDQNK